jgi:hypothetical protein
MIFFPKKFQWFSVENWQFHRSLCDQFLVFLRTICQSGFFCENFSMVKNNIIFVEPGTQLGVLEVLDWFWVWSLIWIPSAMYPNCRLCTLEKPKSGLEPIKSVKNPSKNMTKGFGMWRLRVQLGTSQQPHWELHDAWRSSFNPLPQEPLSLKDSN